jgi:hypothetical protein
MAASESSMPSSMLTSMICAPFSTCCLATTSAAAVVTGNDQLAELGRARHVGALADVHEQRVGADIQRLESDSLSLTGSDGTERGGCSRTAALIAAICAGVVPQQPPTMLINPDAANSPRMPAIACGVSS